MLSKKDFLWLLTFAYVGFAEWTSTWWSQFPLCLLVSENETTNTNTGQQACASLFAGVVRFFHFLWKEADHDNITAVATVMIAVFTLTLWRSTKRLWQAHEHQSAQQANDTRILQRAYLDVDVGGIDRTIPDTMTTPPPSVGHIVIRNTGHLPARRVSLFINTRTSGDDGEEELPIGEITEQNRALMPGARMTVGSPPLQFEDIDRREARWAYVWGRVTYEDGFGDSRFTNFCHRYPTARLNGDWAGGFRIAAEHGRNHEHGNDIG
jgi:hypothetical protein